MARNMSFAMTTQQFKDRTKTVTRRFGWDNLKAGTIICGVEKGMGLKPGEKVKRLGYIRILSTRREHLYEITKDDCVKEGFPDFAPIDFINFLSKNSNKKIHMMDMVNRIEFEYVDGPNG